jgi:hypothetical protein
MSGPAPRDWEALRAELEEKGYLAPGKGLFLLRFSLRKLTPGGPLLRLGLLSAALAAVVPALVVTTLVWLTHRAVLPLVFLYYLPPLFAAALASFAVLTGLFRFHPLRNPTSSALLFAFLVAVPASFLLFKPFHLFLPERLDPLMLGAEIALAALLLFPPLRAMAFITWREPDLGKYRAPVKVLTAALALATAGGLLYWLVPGRGPSVPGRLALPPLDKRLAVIAVDGLDLEALTGPDRFAGMVLGALPALRSVATEGVAVPLVPHGAESPPVFWTRVATGFPPEANGIVSLEAWRLRGIDRNLYPLPLSGLFHALGLARETLASTAERKKPAFWELAQWAGRPSLCVNWWSSWPPKDPAVGVVSNLYLIQRLKGKEAVERQHAEFVDRPVHEPSGEAFSEGTRWDELAVAHFRDLAPANALAALYLPGLDVDLYALRRASLADGIRYSLVLPIALGQLDHLLAELTRSGRRVLLIASTGRREAPKAWAVLYPVERKITPPTTAEPEDLYPTILGALGMPVPQNVPGRALPLPWDLPQTGTVAAYPDLATPAAAATRPPVEELRSLGYLQ